MGISGALHIGLRGFTLNTSGDAGSLVDLSFSGLNESRIYRNGEVKIFEETISGFTEVAAYTDGTFAIDIDYSTGVISNVFNGTLSPGSMSIFPSTWTGFSFSPIDLAGSAPAGNYGAFSVTTSMEISEQQIAVPEPAMPAILGLGMIAFATLRRRRSA